MKPHASSGSGMACSTCKSCHRTRLERHGESLDSWDFVVALAGNPNTGKSTVFNSLTGLHQHTGNWPGKTITRTEGGFSFNRKRFKIVDLPGTYSLLSTSLDELIAREFILFGQPDVTLIVTDATQLERNLNLALQILEITDRAVVCLNLIDEAERHGTKIDQHQLSRDLGIPVVPTSARYGKGLPELLQAIHDVASGTSMCNPIRLETEPVALKPALNDLVDRLRMLNPTLPNPRWVALRLLSGDESITKALRNGRIGKLSAQSSTKSRAT